MGAIKTFEAKKVPGLFFIGAVLDVTGWLGGYNFQWPGQFSNYGTESVIGRYGRQEFGISF